jgi:hypothetical protein
MSVDESDDGHSDRFVRCLSADRGGCEGGDKEEWGKFHGGPQMEVVVG